MVSPGQKQRGPNKEASTTCSFAKRLVKLERAQVEFCRLSEKQHVFFNQNLCSKKNIRLIVFGAQSLATNVDPTAKPVGAWAIEPSDKAPSDRHGHHPLRRSRLYLYSAITVNPHGMTK